jgi:hypothetical protein
MAKKTKKEKEIEHMSRNRNVKRKPKEKKSTEFTEGMITHVSQIIDKIDIESEKEKMKDNKGDWRPETWGDEDGNPISE